jgi:hypothetical protein
MMPSFNSQWTKLIIVTKMYLVTVIGKTVMRTLDLIEQRYKGQFVSNGDLVNYVMDQNEQIKPVTITWTIDKMVKDGLAFRAGRGVYGLFKKNLYMPRLPQDAMKVADLLNDKFRYLAVTITETSVLNEFTELQAFISPIIIETDKVALDSVLSELRNNGLNAFLAKDTEAIDRYSDSDNPLIVKRLLKSAPTLAIRQGLATSTLEKLLVDVFCDGEDYMGYDPAMIQEIYENAIARYAINYSSLLHYANTRKRRQEIEQLLFGTYEYSKVKELLK